MTEKKRGRPCLPSGERASAVLHLRIRPQDKQALARAADEAGLTLSAFVLEYALARARGK